MPTTSWQCIILLVFAAASIRGHQKDGKLPIQTSCDRYASEACSVLPPVWQVAHLVLRTTRTKAEPGE